jgi:hypothetical protein
MSPPGRSNNRDGIPAKYEHQGPVRGTPSALREERRYMTAPGPVRAGTGTPPGMAATFPAKTGNIPGGYPAYCFFVPTGIDVKTDNKIRDILKVWGDNTGDVLYVATWDIADRSIIDFLRVIQCRNRPAIVLTDVSVPDAGSFKITIDDDRIIKNEGLLMDILPDLVDCILTGEHKEALKSYIHERNERKMDELFGRVVGALAKFSFSFTPGGITIGLGQAEKK